MFQKEIGATIQFANIGCSDPILNYDSCKSWHFEFKLHHEGVLQLMIPKIEELAPNLSFEL